MLSPKKMNRQTRRKVSWFLNNGRWQQSVHAYGSVALKGDPQRLWVGIHADNQTQAPTPQLSQQVPATAF
jgi:hypothetical protein